MENYICEEYGITYRLNISVKRNIWIMWQPTYKKLSMSFGWKSN